MTDNPTCICDARAFSICVAHNRTGLAPTQLTPPWVALMVYKCAVLVLIARSKTGRTENYDLQSVRAMPTYLVVADHTHSLYVLGSFSPSLVIPLVTILAHSLLLIACF